MTSLPMPAPFSEVAAMPPDARAESARGEGEQFLLEAFRSFAEAAGSLERSYGMLRSEVARLHRELEQSNAGLARSLEENRRMREHLDRILDGLPCGVLVAGADGAISRVNPEGRRLLTSSRTTGSQTIAVTEEATQEAAEEAGDDFVSLHLIPEGLRALLERARTEAVELDQCLAGESGEERWIAVRHAAVENPESGADCESIFILRDVSAAKKLVRERDQLRREQTLAEMSATLAHEIRNPLGSLELFAGLLAGAGLSPECRQWVEQVQAGLRTLAATVNNVLHFHSLPAPQRAPVDLGELLDWAGGFLVPMARQARVELCLRNHLQGVCFSADRHRLEQVLLNLVLNALRAMPGGGWVEISGHRIDDCEAETAVIAVSDTGPGVTAGCGAKIFEAGFSTHGGSPGLGLAVCRKIVEQHGGRMAAANRPGAGASFTLLFPLAEGWKDRPADSGRDSGLGSGEKEAGE